MGRTKLTLALALAFAIFALWGCGETTSESSERRLPASGDVNAVETQGTTDDDANTAAEEGSPDTLDRSVVDEVRTIADDDAFDMARRLAREEGVLVGISAGANVHMAVEVAASMAPGQKVVTILCDSGLRYLSARVFE